MNILLQTRKLIYLLLTLTVNISVFGQDIHFSQFLNSPLTLSPANTGNFEGDWRIVGNYRDQWRALNFPYRTISASYDRQLYIQKHHISVGAFLVNDNASYAFLKTSSLFASGAYHLSINKHTITGGIQIGYVQRKIDMGNITLPESWTDVYAIFDPNIQVSGIENSSNYLDINLGFNWSRKIRIFEPQVGFALYHINRPNASFIGGKYIKPLRNTFFASVKTNFSPTFFIKPAFCMTSEKKANDFILGSEFGFGLQGNRYNIREISAGVFMRNLIVENTDAFVAQLGVQYSNLAINLSYDINVSSLNQYTNSRGAFEISVIFKSISTIIKTFTIPCERI